MTRRTLTLRCHAKINLGLRVLGVRQDGYHDVRTVLQVIDLHDTLQVSPARKLALEIGYEWADGSRQEIPADASNLVLKAAAALRKPMAGRGAAFRLTKRIPAGAGLGGASSDAAAALLALDRLQGLSLGPSDLHRAAASVGSDVPFFLYGGACLALGRGEEVYPLPDGPALDLVVAFPGEGLATEEVYRAWDSLLTSSGNVSKVNDFAPWCLVLRGGSPGVANDLEAASLEVRPSLGRLRGVLDAAGATAVSMTGSGSAFYGVFTGAEAAADGARRVREAGFIAVTARSLGRAERDRALWSGWRPGSRGGTIPKER